MEKQRQEKHELQEKHKQYRDITKQLEMFQLNMLDNHDIGQRNSRTGDKKRSTCLNPEAICEQLVQPTYSSAHISTVRQLFDQLKDQQNLSTHDTIVKDLLNDCEIRRSSEIFNDIKSALDNTKVDSILNYLEHRKNKVKTLTEKNNSLALDCQQAESLVKEHLEKLHSNPLLRVALM